MKKHINRKASRQVLENLENRQLYSSILLNGTSLELHGDAGQSNSFVVRPTDNNQVLAFANNTGETASLDACKQVVIYLGSKTDTVNVESGVTTPVEVIDTTGKATWLTPGEQETFTGSGGSSSAGVSSDSGGGSSGSGGGSSATGGEKHHKKHQKSSGGSGDSTGASGSGGSSGTSGTGGGSSSGGSTSSTGSGSGSSNSGGGTSGSGSGSSGSGSSSSGSGGSSSGTGSGSSGSGSGSSGSGSGGSGSGSSSSGSGSGSSGSGTGSSGSGSSSSGSGSSSSGTGSSSSGSGTGASNPNDPATPDAVITVTTPAGVLPMESVNVQAVNSTFGSGTDINSTISWDFGDPGSKYNDLVGFNAAHVYANAGTYTITLTITTPDGHVGIATQQVTVGADNRPTVEIAAGESIPTFQSNTRYLFQAGGTYDVGNTAISLANLQHVYIGSYGSGAQPIIKYTGNNLNGIVVFNGNSSGITIQGLTFDSIYTTDGTGQADAIQPIGNDLAFIGNTFLNMQYDFNLNGVPSNILIQDNSSPDKNDLDGYFAWIQGSEIAVIGNTVANSLDQADFRIGGAATTGGTTDLLVYDNTFDKTTIAKNCMSIQWIDYAYIYGNTTNGGPVQLGPIGTDSSQDPTNAACMNVVVDSNKMEVLEISPESIDTMVRNNLINNPNAAGIVINAEEIGGGYNWQVQNLTIENNTVDETTTDGGFLNLTNGEAQNVVVDNNLFVDPNMVMGDNESAYIVDTNNDLNSFSEIKDNVWGTPNSIDSWNNGGEFYMNSSPQLQPGWLTPSEWEQETLGSGGSPTGDVCENVSLGSTYSVNVDGFTAGSDLATS